MHFPAERLPAPPLACGQQLDAQPLSHGTDGVDCGVAEDTAASGWGSTGLHNWVPGTDN